MALSKKEFLDILKGIKMDDVLLFNTKPQDKQIFIISPSINFPGKYNVYECSDLGDSFKKYFGCNIEVSEKNGELFVKVFQGYKVEGYDSNLTCTWSRNPIDETSIQIKENQIVEKIIIEETERQKSKRQASYKYAKTEETMKSLILADVTIRAKNTRFRDDGRGEGYYSYDEKTTQFEYGLSTLVTIFSSCIKQYGFQEDISFFNNYSELMKMIEQKNPEDAERTIELNKQAANRLGYAYVKFLKYLANNNIEIDKNYKYENTFSKNGFGSDRKYIITVSEPIEKIRKGISRYIQNVLGTEQCTLFDDETSKLLEKIRSGCSK